MSLFKRFLTVMINRLEPLSWLLHLWYYNLFKTSVFVFNDRLYWYEYHYPKTWFNERCVELPIVWDIVKMQNGKNILEVGNVLSHYYPISHDVVDKYDIAKGVINEDIVSFKPDKKYDLIVSISTIEHIGWDEKPRESGKILTTLENMKSLLSENGFIVLTFPLGYNSELDELVEKGKIRFSNIHYLKRIAKDNRWKEVRRQGLDGVKYNAPYPRGNGIVIGKIRSSYQRGYCNDERRLAG